ncbi:MAG: radical SAM protein [Nitrospirae bacterium]|nr:radical SAM protein [Nitrospirota bacterium]
MAKKRVILISFNWANHFSLALGYLKAFAQKDESVLKNADIDIADFDTETHDSRQVVYYISQSKPDIIGFSCYCWNINKVLETARMVKMIYPNIKIVLGGPEVGPISSKYLKENPYIDVIVKGEGEVTFSELLKSYLGKGRLDQVQGITYRNNNDVIENPDRPLIENLGEIPSPYLEGILTPRDKVTYIETFRGCIFRCSYCFEGKNFPKPRFFPDERIKKEIEFIMSIPEIKSFHFVDPIFNLKKDRLKRIVEILSSSNRFGTELRTVEIIAEFVDEETIELFEKANVKSVETGPQTVNKDTLKNVNRYFEEDKFKRGVRLLEDNGIEVLTDLIIGLPGDTFFKFVNSVKTLINIRPTTIIFSILHVLPGTTLYQQSSVFEIKFDDKAPHLILEAPFFPYEEIDKAVIMAHSLDKEYNIKPPSALEYNLI